MVFWSHSHHQRRLFHSIWNKIFCDCRVFIFSSQEVDQLLHSYSPLFELYVFVLWNVKIVEFDGLTCLFVYFECAWFMRKNMNLDAIVMFLMTLLELCLWVLASTFTTWRMRGNLTQLIFPFNFFFTHSFFLNHHPELELNGSILQSVILFWAQICPIIL